MNKFRANSSRRAERTKERILLYSIRLFRERGIRKVTVDEICAGMSLSKRTFYKFFRGRDGLVEEIIDRAVSDWLELLGKNLDAGGVIEEVFLRHCLLVSELLDTHTSALMLADVQATMPELWLRIEQLRREVTDLMIEMIRKGQAEGSLRSEIEPGLAGKIVQGVIYAVANPTFASTNGLSLDRVSRALTEILLHGILVRETPDRQSLRSRKNEGG